MNDIKQYFSSPTKLVASPSTGQPSSHSSQQTKKVNTRRESVYHTPTGSKSHASSTPRSSSTCSRKLIVSNMASVISSVEKQRKTKRKRDELKKRKQREQPEPDISNISNILSHKLHFVSPIAANGEAANVVSAAADMTNDLDGVELLEVMDVDNDSQLDAKPSKSPPLANGFASPPRKSLSNTSISSDRSAKENKNTHSRTTNHRTSPKTTTTPKKKSLFTASAPVVHSTAASSSSSKPKNAFELMMSARNKSIGGNSPGKETTTTDHSPCADAASPSGSGQSKTKRKLMLEEWADRKGGAKRKMQEADAEEYVNHQMKKRAKRLRKLLSNRKSSRDLDDDDADAPVIEVFVDEEGAGEGNTTALSVSLKLNFKKTTPKSKVKCKKLAKIKRESDIEKGDSTAEDEAEFQRKIDTVVETAQRRILESKSTSPSIPLKTKTNSKSDATLSKTPTKVPRKPHVTRRKSPKTPTKSPKPPKSPVVSKACEVDLVLSSPIKKRDSLLGYFNKIEKSPTSTVIVDEVFELLEVIPIADDGDEVATPPPKRRGRPPKKSKQNTFTPITPREATPPPCVERLADTPSTSNTVLSRTRRGCRDKTTTNYADNSPAKAAAQKSLKRACRLLSGGCSPQKSPGKSPRPSQKLAPIFVKAPLKPMVDPEVSKARQDFLMSGIPERMKLDLERQRLFEQSYECELDLFPAVSHVTQLPPPTIEDAASQATVITMRILDDTPLSTPATFRIGSTQTSPPPIVLTSTANPDDLKLTRPKELVKLLKDTDSGRFLYFRCYKQLRKKFNDDHPNSSDKPIPECFASSLEDSVEFVVPSFDNQTGSEMFTEKYKPLTAEEIVVNSAPAYQLKKFLATWQENFHKQKPKRRAGANADDDDDDDFEMESNSTSALNKAVMLLGPTGNGKTNAVYALAHEMNFNVLEINAGTKRTGKKMLLELQEATQSHQVKGGGGADCRIFRGSQTTAQSSEESSNGFGTSQSAQKLSLILIEDADIVFEQDNGFIDAMYQLVATSKRPVILVANQRSCSHLTRFTASNVIVFSNADQVHAGKWLSMLSIAEHRYIGHDECARLYVHNGYDMRRTILELQFFLQSGGDQRRIDGPDETHYLHQSLYDSFTRNHNQSQVVPYPVDFDSVHDKTAAILRTDDESRSLEDVLSFYDTIAAAQYIQSGSGCIDDDCLTSNLSQEMSHYMVEGAVSRMQSANFYLDPPVKNPVKRDRNLLAPSIYTGASSSTTNIARRRSINLDVEPCLRTICRSEKMRTQTERRSSRFYHYLRNAVTSSFSTDGFDEHCGVLSVDHIPSGDAPNEPSNSMANP